MMLVVRHMNNIAALLIEEPDAFEPMFEERIWKNDTVVVVDEWCEGYLRGVSLAADVWRAAEPALSELLAPILAFTQQTDWRASKLNDPDAVARLRAAIAPNVRAIHAYWLARRANDTTATSPQRTTSVGRNEPCPCGSGKKYKRCCLQ